ncbi:MAG: lactonase family protein [Bacteroides sp.]|nr:lactonase family protein [Bacteroides sp.]
MLSIATGLIMLVGSYGTPDETNFRTYTFNTESGTIVPIDSIAGLSNPSFLAVADKGETVFAVNENDSYGDSELTMLRKDGADGHYVPVSRQMVIGKNPCHVAVAPNGEYVVTANYGSGSISVFKFKGADKLLEKPRVVKFSGQSVDSIRQSMPHPHCTTFTPDGKFMVVTDLGTDRIHQFPLDYDGDVDLSGVLDVSVSPGFGPRHIVFDAKCENGYMINELTGNISHFRYSTYHDTMNSVNAYESNSGHVGGGADIHISPCGRWVYASNRLNGDGIAQFKIDTSNGWELVPMSYVSTGKHPRNFNITPDGKWLLVACKDDNRIEVFKCDEKSGNLTPTGYSISCPQPVCIVFNDPEAVAAN